MLTPIDGGKKKKKIIHLEEWEEIVGVFKDISEEDSFIHINFENFQLIFDLESQEAKICQEKLDGAMPGDGISILKTDSSEKPILVRVEKSEQVTTAPFILPHKGKKLT